MWECWEIRLIKVLNIKMWSWRLVWRVLVLTSVSSFERTAAFCSRCLRLLRVVLICIKDLNVVLLGDVIICFEYCVVVFFLFLFLVILAFARVCWKFFKMVKSSFASVFWFEFVFIVCFNICMCFLYLIFVVLIVCLCLCCLCCCVVILVFKLFKVFLCAFRKILNLLMTAFKVFWVLISFLFLLFFCVLYFFIFLYSFVSCVEIVWSWFFVVFNVSLVVSSVWFKSFCFAWCFLIVMFVFCKYVLVSFNLFIVLLYFLVSLLCCICKLRRLFLWICDSVWSLESLSRDLFNNLFVMFFLVLYVFVWCIKLFNCVFVVDKLWVFCVIWILVCCNVFLFCLIIFIKFMSLVLVFLSFCCVFWRVFCVCCIIVIVFWCLCFLILVFFWDSLSLILYWLRFLWIFLSVLVVIFLSTRTRSNDLFVEVNFDLILLSCVWSDEMVWFVINILEWFCVIVVVVCFLDWFNFVSNILSFFFNFFREMIICLSFVCILLCFVCNISILFFNLFCLDDDFVLLLCVSFNCWCCSDVLLSRVLVSSSRDFNFFIVSKVFFFWLWILFNFLCMVFNLFFCVWIFFWFVVMIFVFDVDIFEIVWRNSASFSRIVFIFVMVLLCLFWSMISLFCVWFILLCDFLCCVFVSMSFLCILVSLICKCDFMFFATFLNASSCCFLSCFIVFLIFFSFDWVCLSWFLRFFFCFDELWFCFCWFFLSFVILEWYYWSSFWSFNISAVFLNAVVGWFVRSCLCFLCMNCSFFLSFLWFGLILNLCWVFNVSSWNWVVCNFCWSELIFSLFGEVMSLFLKFFVVFMIEGVFDFVVVKVVCVFFVRCKLMCIWCSCLDKLLICVFVCSVLRLVFISWFFIVFVLFDIWWCLVWMMFLMIFLDFLWLFCNMCWVLLMMVMEFRIIRWVSDSAVDTRFIVWRWIFVCFLFVLFILFVMWVF